MTVLERLAGQSPILPAAVIAGELISTSGIVAPEAFAAIATGGEVPVERQISGALGYLLETLDRAGSSPDHVMKIEAFLARAEDFAAFNAAYLEIWPNGGPARTTLVVGFTSPVLLFELHALAVRA